MSGRGGTLIKDPLQVWVAEPLAPYARGPEIRAAINAFARQAWTQARDPATGLFHFGHTLSTLLDQAAMVQVYAELARTT